MNHSSSELYTLVKHKQVDDDQYYTLALDPQHPIYKGHFPQQPILPGACFLQMVTELVAHAVGFPLNLRQVRAAKFPNALNPQQTPNLVIVLHCTPIDKTYWSVQATASNETRVFLKFKGTFVKPSVHSIL